MRRDLNPRLNRNKKRVCPKCGSDPHFLFVDGRFVVNLECPKCGHKFTGANGKVVSE